MLISLLLFLPFIHVVSEFVCALIYVVRERLCILLNLFDLSFELTPHILHLLIDDRLHIQPSHSPLDLLYLAISHQDWIAIFV